jgi:DNA polymerase
MTTAQKRQKLLDEVAADLARSKCPLRKTATHAVPGEGSPVAKLFFIGEAPGKNEDLQGRPFVGAAGRVLNEFLASIKIRREDVFITSVEKFRPPQNRDPHPKEIMACFPYLERQLTIIKPKIIVCMGRHAVRRMLEWEQGAPLNKAVAMDAVHGKLIRGASGRLYYPIYHPAAALYGFSRDMMKKDFARLVKLLK